MTRGIAGLMIVAALSLGCASVPRPGNAALEQEIARLESELLAARRRVVMAEVELTRLREQLAELHAGPPPVPEPDVAAADSVATSSGESGTTSAILSESVPESISVVAPPGSEGAAAPADESAPEAAQADEAGAIASSDLEMEPVELDPEAPTPTPDTAAAAPAASSGSPVSAAPRPVDPAGQLLYDEGYTAYHQGRYAEAESRFSAFLSDYDDSSLADNALYWIGQARLERGDVDGALDAFRETVERFPEGNKIPEALLSAGACLETLDRVEEAQVTYRELANRYPRTAAAEIAQDRLAALE